MAPNQQANETMPPNNQTTGVKIEDAQAEEVDWDEEQLEKAMNTLKELHIQLRDLRTTIPRLIAPLATKHPSPEVMFRQFSAAESTANKEVQQFRKLMEDKESTKVLQYANKSRAERPSGIKPWRVTEHPDWLTVETPS